MKKLLLVLVLFISCLMVQSQVYIMDDVGEVVNLNIKEDLGMIRLIGVTKGWTLNRVRLYIDYGQKSDLKEKDSYIVNSDGNKLEFQSVIGAMNHIEKNGWEYLNDGHTLTGTGNGSIVIGVYYYTFRKK